MTETVLPYNPGKDLSPRLDPPNIHLVEPSAWFSFDLETVPSSKPGRLQRCMDEVEPPRNMSKPETIAKWLAENKEDKGMDAFRKLALHWTEGEIAGFGFRFNFQPRSHALIRGTRYEGEGEKSFLSRSLKQWAKALGRPGSQFRRKMVAVGHNITGFDLPFIWHRCQVNGILPPPEFPHYLDGDKWIRDTMVLWQGRYALGDKKFIKMEALAEALGVELDVSKEETSGRDVLDLFLNGEWKKLKRYLRSDVMGPYRIFKKMCFTDANPIVGLPPFPTEGEGA